MNPLTTTSNVTKIINYHLKSFTSTKWGRERPKKLLEAHNQRSQTKQVRNNLMRSELRVGTHSVYKAASLYIDLYIPTMVCTYPYM